MSRPPAPADPAASLGARWAALRNIWPFLKMVWRTSPAFTLVSLSLRAIRAVLPVAALWLAKLIIDKVIRVAALPGLPETLQGWWESGIADWLLLLGGKLDLVQVDMEFRRVAELRRLGDADLHPGHPDRLA
jgi:ATP-binding cassette subfamily B protein